jgi:hypothetical protein
MVNCPVRKISLGFSGFTSLQDSYVMMLIALSVTKSVAILENKVDARVDAVDAKIRSLDAKVEALNTSIKLDLAQ